LAAKQVPGTRWQIDMRPEFGYQRDVFEPSARRTLALMQRSVLIVDDEENLLVLLDSVLSKEGFHVRTTSNAYHALELVDHWRFKLAILDIKMFPIDGVALLSEIKKRTPSTQVIMITAYPTADTRNECLRIGAADYLTKPLDIHELKTVVQTLAAA